MGTSKMQVDHQFLEQNSVQHFQVVLNIVVPAQIKVTGSPRDCISGTHKADALISKRHSSQIKPL